MVNIGGFHITKSKILPWELRRKISKAKDGVIFFNTGSLMDPSIITNRKLMEVLRMFGKRNETVIWRYNGEFPIKPNNVIIKKRLHQQDILGKFFINTVNIIINLSHTLFMIFFRLTGEPSDLSHLLFPFINVMFLNVNMLYGI